MVVPFLFFFQEQRIIELPRITIKTILTFAGRDTDGQLVEAVGDLWFEIIRIFQRDPQAIYKFDWRQWEEIVAGAWRKSGFDEVKLTPRSGDRGRDVIATKHDGSWIRLFDQVKAYSPGYVVTAAEVSAMLGRITSQSNVSKGIITTTSEFAPRLMDDPDIKRFIPYRLELKADEDLQKWLKELLDKKPR
jgi:restriction system protein